ncbi:MAG: VacJ family lipoprotein, partial [Desulfohalobiaceae bacterium]|nr:VacJ family lipoprotein [Desulfohalobiaceae bacterium]
MRHGHVRFFFVLLCLLPGLLLQASPGWAQGAGDEALLEELAADYEQAGDREVSDPLETWNRAVFSLNDRLYLYLLQPAARGYATVVPEEIRTGV